MIVEQYRIAVVGQSWLIAQGKNEIMMSQIRVEAEGERKRIQQLQQRSYQPGTEDC